MPFCRRHANMLPEAHKKRLWDERARDEKKCGACDVVDDDRSDSWHMLYELAVALLVLIEFGDSPSPMCTCGAPSTYRDETGFCWSCGIDNSEETYRIAKLVVRKYNIQVGV